MWILQGDGETGGRLTFRVSPGTIKTVGRARGADFVLDAALVSRLHCRLEAGDEALEGVDLESTNGTVGNDKRITRAKRVSGDRLRVGRVQLEVEYVES